MSSLLRIVCISLCVLFCVVAQAIPEHEQAATEPIERTREIPSSHAERAERLRERERDSRPVRERSFERDPREALRDLRHTLLDPTIPPSISLRERERVREEMRDYLMNQYIRASVINMRYAQDLAALEPYLYPRPTAHTSAAATAAEEEDLNAMYEMAEEDDENTDLMEQDFEISAPYGGFGGYGGGYGGYGGGYGGKKGKKVPYKKVPYKKVPYKKVPYKKVPYKKGGFGGFGGI